MASAMITPRKRIAKLMSAAWIPWPLICCLFLDLDLRAELFREKHLSALAHHLGIGGQAFHDISARWSRRIRRDLAADERLRVVSHIDPRATLPPNNGRRGHGRTINHAARGQEGKNIHPWQQSRLRGC